MLRLWGCGTAGRWREARGLPGAQTEEEEERATRGPRGFVDIADPQQAETPASDSMAPQGLHPQHEVPAFSAEPPAVSRLAPRACRRRGRRGRSFSRHGTSNNGGATLEPLPPPLSQHRPRSGDVARQVVRGGVKCGCSRLFRPDSVEE
ncbi:unnamed protein product [Lampetra planeri]